MLGGFLGEPWGKAARFAYEFDNKYSIKKEEPEPEMTVRGSNPHGTSAWVACRDKRPRKRYTRRWYKFQQRVQRAVDPNFKQYTIMNDYSFFVLNGAYDQAQFTASQFGLYQVSMNALTGPYNGASYAFDYPAVNAPSTNPAHMLTTTYKSNGYNLATPADVDPISTDFNTMGIPVTVTALTGFPRRVVQKKCISTLELRNPQPSGLRVVIYSLKRRNGMALGTRPTGNVDNYWATNGAPYYGTPLEDWAFGMYMKGYSPTSAVGNRSIALTDSVKFNDNWRIRKKCSVYLPPGGTTLQYFKSGERMMDVQKLRQLQKMNGEEWLVIKVYQEVQFLQGSNSTTNAIIGVPTNVHRGNAGTSLLNDDVQGSAIVPSHASVIGQLSIRRKYVVLPETDNPDIVNVGAQVPAGAVVQIISGNQYYPVQQEDVGGLTNLG